MLSMVRNPCLQYKWYAFNLPIFKTFVKPQQVQFMALLYIGNVYNANLAIMQQGYCCVRQYETEIDIKITA